MYIHTNNLSILIYYKCIYIFTACARTLEWPFPLKRMHALPSRKTTCPEPPMLPLSEERVCMVMSRNNALQYGLKLVCTWGASSTITCQRELVVLDVKKVHLAAYSNCSIFVTSMWYGHETNNIPHLIKFL